MRKTNAKDYFRNLRTIIGAPAATNALRSVFVVGFIIRLATKEPCDPFVFQTASAVEVELVWAIVPLELALLQYVL